MTAPPELPGNLEGVALGDVEFDVDGGHRTVSEGIVLVGKRAHEGRRVRAVAAISDVAEGVAERRVVSEELGANGD